MNDYTELKRLALSTKPLVDGSSFAIQQYYAAASPDVVLGLIAQNQALLEALKDSEFDNWFEQYRKNSWEANLCHKDRGPEPSAHWCQGLRWDFKRGWDAARAAIALAEGKDV